MTSRIKTAGKVLALLPAWLVVPFVIWNIDPQGLFRPHPHDRARAQLVAEGQAVVWPDTANYRSFVREIIPRMSRCDIVVIGSSRVFSIGQTPFVPRSFKNLGVTCATLEELRAIVELLRREEKLPAHLIVGVDPWTFNPRHLERGPDRCLRTAGRISPCDDRRETQRQLQTLISPPYFQMSLQFWLQHQPVTAASPNLSTEIYQRRGDGSFTEPGFVKTPGATPAERTQFRVQQAIRDQIWSEFAYRDGDGPMRQALIEMISRVPSVSILLVPLHPDFFQVVQAEPTCQRALQQEAWLRTFAAEHNISVIGSFDPEKCGLTGLDFVDATHAGHTAMAHFAEELAAAIRE